MKALLLCLIPVISAAVAPEILLCRINKIRTDGKLEPLGLSANMTAAAQSHSEDMAAHDDLSSTGSDGSTAESRAQQFGIKYRLLGEVIAAGYRDADDLVTGLQKDPRYNSYFLSKDYEMFGHGFARDSNDEPYWTLEFAQLWRERSDVPQCNPDGTWVGENPTQPPEAKATKVFRSSSK